MPKYSELVEQIEALQKEAEQVRRQEFKAVVADVKAKIKAYEISADDLADVLGLSKPKTAKKSAARKAKKARNGAKRGKVAPKYRHPVTGDTWTGRGREPKWLVAEMARGRQRAEFLITS